MIHRNLQTKKKRNCFPIRKCHGAYTLHTHTSETVQQVLFNSGFNWVDLNKTTTKLSSKKWKLAITKFGILMFGDKKVAQQSHTPEVQAIQFYWKPFQLKRSKLKLLETQSCT